MYAYIIKNSDPSVKGFFVSILTKSFLKDSKNKKIVVER
jgi:hypothetical protein